MFLISVIPISRNSRVGHLSYFCSVDVPEGAVISVPLRGKNTRALVIHSTPAEKEKTHIKGARFALRKIHPKQTHVTFDPAVITASKQCADYYATNVGGILFHTIAHALSEGEYSPGKQRGTSTLFEQQYIQATDADRFAQYKSIVRESFAQKESVCIIVPTQHDAEKLFTTLSRGIEAYTYVLHGTLTKKQQKETAERAVHDPHPILLIATPPFLALPRPDVRTIIIEREASRAYRTHAQPFISYTYYIEAFARASRIRLVRADTVLSLETFKTIEDTDPALISSLTFRPLTNAVCTIVDVEEERKKAVENNEPWSVLTHPLKKLIERAHDESKQLFLFNAKRGLAPQTLCGDCGSVVLCTQCNKTIVLHKTASGNVFLCHRCGEKRSAKETCRTCGGWNLKTFGIGTERIVEEIKEQFPNARVFHLDSDTASTYAKGKKIYSAFRETPGGILVGTETAIHFLAEPIPFVGIVSIDSLFAIPDFRINERIVSLVTTLRSNSTEQFIIQTREPNDPTLGFAMRGSLLEFLRTELALRQEFNYPPFSVPIRITVTDKKERAKKTITDISEKLTEYNPKTYPAFVQKKGLFSMHLIIFVSHRDWIDKNLIQILATLPQQSTLVVDPETIL